jgi:hypothetical protein
MKEYSFEKLEVWEQQQLAVVNPKPQYVPNSNKIQNPKSQKGNKNEQL